MNLRDGKVVHYAAGATGLANRGVSWPGLDGVDVLVRPTTGTQEDADELARAIRDHAVVQGDLRGALGRAKAERDDAVSRLAYLTRERLRTMGRVVARPARGSGEPWSGPVWLLDERKGWGGFGLRWESVADLWSDMPDLRPTAAGEDELGPWIRLESMPVAE